jgi:hypothetical protein
MTWKTATKPRACNTFPDVWAAIVGCTGSGKAWRRTAAHGGIGGLGHAGIEYACPTCQAARTRLDALRGPAYQAALTELQAAAGVADYRVAEVVRRDGRPVLTGRVDVNAAREAVEYALMDYTAGGSLVRALHALRVLCGAGGAVHAKRLVADRCTAAQAEALRAAWRAAR